MTVVARTRKLMITIALLASCSPRNDIGERAFPSTVGTATVATNSDEQRSLPSSGKPNTSTVAPTIRAVSSSTSSRAVSNSSSSASSDAGPPMLARLRQLSPRVLNSLIISADASRPGVKLKEMAHTGVRLGDRIALSLFGLNGPVGRVPVWLGEEELNWPSYSDATAWRLVAYIPVVHQNAFLLSYSEGMYDSLAAVVVRKDGTVASFLPIAEFEGASQVERTMSCEIRDFGSLLLTTVVRHLHPEIAGYDSVQRSVRVLRDGRLVSRRRGKWVKVRRKPRGGHDEGAR